jgi:arylsulfatase A-like enzyme
VLIVVDTLRRDHVSAYGGAVRTPNVDRLAARGQVLPHAVSSFHQTSMSMGALFTGRTPSIESGDPGTPLHWNGRTWCGLARLAAADDPEASCVPRGLPTLAERLREAGYRTVGVASNEFLFRPSGFDRGFDAWVEVGLPRSGTGTTEAEAPAQHETLKRARAGSQVNRAVRALLDRVPPDDLFLYVHYMDAHDWDLHGSYARAVAVMDEAIGVLLDELASRDLLDDAIVVLTSDHGEALAERHVVPGSPGHAGNPSFEELLRVPLLVAPAVIDDPERLVRSEDLGGLLLQLAGGTPAPASDLEPEELYLSERRFQTYRRAGWKSMRWRRTQKVLLFDLAADPGETRDVAGRHPAMAQEHVERMGTLARRLAAAGDQPAVLSPTDARRLRALGYLE